MFKDIGHDDRVKVTSFENMLNAQLIEVYSIAVGVPTSQRFIDRLRVCVDSSQYRILCLDEVLTELTGSAANIQNH